ncbi:methyl-accepting chemotaxis protein [Deltaproteobacteria bacterium TL4]
MTIKKELGGGFGLVLGLLLLVFVLGYQMSNQIIEEYESKVLSTLSINGKAKDLSTASLQIQTNENNLLMRNDLAYADQTIEYAKQAIELAQAIGNVSEDPQIKEWALQSETETNAYIENFKELRKALEFRGLDEKSGVQGTFNSRAELIGEASQKHDVSSIYQNFIQIRNFEKGYYLTQDPTFINEHQKAMMAFASQLFQSAADKEVKKQIKDQFRDYKQSWSNYVEAPKKLARKELYQQVDEKAETLTKTIKAYYIPDSTNVYLSLRKYEKDFLLWSHREDLGKVNDMVIQYKLIIADTTIGSEVKAKLKEILDDYYEALLQWSEVMLRLREYIAISKQHIQNTLQLTQKIVEHQELLTRAAQDAIKEYTRKGQLWMLFFSVLALIIGVLIAFLIVRNMVVSFKEFIRISEKISAGDLRERVGIFIKKKSPRSLISNFYSYSQEIIQMARTMDHLSEKLEETIWEITEDVDIVVHASQELNAFSSKIATNSEAMEKQTSTIALFSSKLSSNVNTIAAAAEESSTNVLTITATVEELSAMINNIATNSGNASSNMEGMSLNIGQISRDINQVATSIEKMSSSLVHVSEKTQNAAMIAQVTKTNVSATLETMNNLGEKANNIGNFVKQIDDISDQTNMLALNAAIEASKAGEAGRGFEIVAKEVKTLAAQTSALNNDIGERIDTIQQYTENALSRTQAVVDIINKLEEIIHFISGAIGQQSDVSTEINRFVEAIASASNLSTLSIRKATEDIKEIQRSTVEASHASQESARNLSEASFGVREVAQTSAKVSVEIHNVDQSIQGIQFAVEEVNGGVSFILNNAKELSKMAEALKQTISYFKLADNKQH